MDSESESAGEVVKHRRNFVAESSTGGSRRSHWRGPAAASANNMEQISELGESGGMPPGKFFFLMMQIGPFLSGLWGGAMAPLAPPLEPPMVAIYVRHKSSLPALPGDITFAK